MTTKERPFKKGEIIKVINNKGTSLTLGELAKVTGYTTFGSSVFVVIDLLNRTKKGIEYYPERFETTIINWKKEMKRTK